VRGWWDVEPLISKVEGIWGAVSGMLCLLLLISTALTVINVIFMTVNERVVEIGTLMAVGAKPYMIRILFAVEGAVIGIAGGFAGCIFGNICLAVMGAVGIPFESPFGSGVEMIYPKVDLWWTIAAMSASTVICAFCSLPPANRAARVDPVVAFKNIF
jgi:putative ABC transport system permease protein